MEPVGIVLVVVSAFLHAGWNLLCKKNRPSAAFFLIAVTTSAIALTILVLPQAPVLSRLSGKFWLLVVFTGMAESVYYAALAAAYRRVDMSTAYPLIRALPMLLIPVVVTALSMGETLDFYAVCGMAALAAGCVALALPGANNRAALRRLMPGLWAVALAAIAISAYTIIDSEGMRLINGAEVLRGNIWNALAYIWLSSILILPGLAFVVACSRRERGELRKILQSGIGGNLRYPILSGLSCTVAYTLILLAMLFASNVSYVMAFRQISIPMGVALGYAVLRERPGWQKIGGVVIIIGGLLLLAIR